MNILELHHFTDLINSYLPSGQATLLNGIVFGLPIKSDYPLYLMVKKVGLLPLVVLSGMNISILFSLTDSFLHIFSKNIRILLSAIILTIFIYIVKPQAPIMRAAIMVYVTLVATIIGRGVKPLYALFISTITIGVIWPSWITSLSFMLSFFSTLGIVLFSQPNKLTKHNESWFIRALKANIRISLSAQVLTIPLVFLYFREIALLSPISNLLITPFIGPIMMLGIITVLMGSIWWVLGIIPSFICYGLLTVVLFIIQFLSKIPYIFITHQ